MGDEERKIVGNGGSGSERLGGTKDLEKRKIHNGGRSGANNPGVERWVGEKNLMVEDRGVEYR